MKERELLEKELGRGDIIRKNELARELEYEIEQEIMTAEDSSPEVATSLGGRLLSYYAEAVLHNVDRMTIEMKADIIEHGEIVSKYEVEKINFRRLETENAIILASREGDYTGIKSILTRWATLAIYEKRRVKFLQLVSSIPDKAQPFILPLPAWIVKETRE